MMSVRETRLLWAICSVVVAFTSLSAAGSEAAEKAEHTIVADPEIQAQISRTIRAYSKVTPEAPQRMAKAYCELLELLKLDTDDGIRLTRQIIYLHIQSYKERNDDKWMGAMRLFRETNIGEQAIAIAIVPYIGTTDEALAEYIEHALDTAEYHGETRERNFTVYEGALTTERGAPQLPLIEHMYRKAPGKALLACMSLGIESEGVKPIVWAEHVVADVLWKQKWKFIPPDKTTPEAVAELEKLSKHKAWWARLYVAAILRQEPEFRTDEIIERLGKDPHPLVRKVIGKTVTQGALRDPGFDVKRLRRKTLTAREF